MARTRIHLSIMFDVNTPNSFQLDAVMAAIVGCLSDQNNVEFHPIDCTEMELDEHDA